MSSEEREGPTITEVVSSQNEFRQRKKGDNNKDNNKFTPVDSSDPRRSSNKRFKPLTPEEEAENASPFQFFAMVAGLVAIMLRLKWASWVSIYCSLAHVCTMSSAEFSIPNVLSTMMISTMGLVMNYFGPNR